MKKYFYRNKTSQDLYDIQEGDLVFVDYVGKLGTFDYARVKTIKGSNATCIFRNHSEKEIPISLLYPLSQKSTQWLLSDLSQSESYYFL